MKVSQFSSITSLKKYAATAQSYNIDYNIHLRLAGIDPVLLSDNNNRIEHAQLETFIEAVARASNDPSFGLKTADFIQADTFNMLGYIALNCANLREYLAIIPLYESIGGDMGFTATESHGDRVLIRWNCISADPLIRRHSVESVLATWLKYTFTIINLREYPSLVWFEHSIPEDPNSISRYQHIFNCEVLFDQRCSGIWVTDQQLDIPFPQANNAMLTLLLDAANKIHPEHSKHEKMTQQVKNTIRLMLVKSLPTQERVAEYIGISGRTLQRKLANEGTRYKELLKEVRMELAQHYLQNTQFSIDIVSAKLGFKDVRSFHRSFKQYTGETASMYRKLTRKKE